MLISQYPFHPILRGPTRSQFQVQVLENGYKFTFPIVPFTNTFATREGYRWIEHCRSNDGNVDFLLEVLHKRMNIECYMTSLMVIKVNPMALA